MTRSKALAGALLLGKIRPGPARLLRLLLDYEHRYGQAWPTMSTLATQLGVARCTVQRWCTEVEALLPKRAPKLRELRFRPRRHPDRPGQVRQTSNLFHVGRIVDWIESLLPSRGKKRGYVPQRKAGASTAPAGALSEKSNTTGVAWSLREGVRRLAEIRWNAEVWAF